MGEGIREGAADAEREMREGDAEREIVGCESPRSTRLMEVGL